MLLLSNEDVAQVLSMESVMGVLERAYADLAEERAVCRPRIDVRIPTRDPEVAFQWGTMEGGCAGGYFAIRMKSDVFREVEHAGFREEEKHCVRPGLFCGLVLLVDVNSGEPLAFLNDGHLQHLRVAADSAIGAKHLARPDARVVGMLGSGGMARSHIEAFRMVRPIERLQVFSPRREHREAYAEEMAARHGIEAVAVDSVAEACRGADIVAICTNAVGRFDLTGCLDAGVHVTAIGGRPDAATYRLFDLCLRLGVSPAPSGRPELGVEDEVIAYTAWPASPVWRHQQGMAHRQDWQDQVRSLPVVYLRDLLNGRARGRENAAQRTYSERGNVQGMQFYAVASVAFEAARERGLGHHVPTEWLLQTIKD